MSFTASLTQIGCGGKGESDRDAMLNAGAKLVALCDVDENNAKKVFAKHADLPNVPLVMDLATTDEQRQILRIVFGRQVLGRPYALPPGVPTDRAAILRRAFTATMKDPEFLTEMERTKLEITAVPGERIQNLVQDIYATTPAEVASLITAAEQAPWASIRQRSGA